MKKLYFLFALLPLSVVATSQTYLQPDLQWQKSLGTTDDDTFEDVLQTTDGGFIAVGRTDGNNFDINDNHGGYDALVVKYNSSGTVEWKKCYGGTLTERGNNIKQTADGGFIITGYSRSANGNLTVNRGFGDGWMFKINNMGILQWQKSYGSSGDDGFSTVVLTADGGYIFTGYCGAEDNDIIGVGFKGVRDVWVVKTNALGIIEWQRSYGSIAGAEFGFDIKPTNDGGYIIAGETNGNDGDVSGLHGTRKDMWVIKITNTGVLQWQKCLGGATPVFSGFFADDGAYGVLQTADGGYIISGYTGSIDGDVTNYKGGISDGWVVKLNNTGTIEWQKTLGGSSGDILKKAVQLPDGGFVICAYSQSINMDLIGNWGGYDVWIVKISSTGTVQWQRNFGTSKEDGANAIGLTTGEGFILAGWLNNNDFDATGTTYFGLNRSCWILKLSSQVLPVRMLDFTGVQKNKNVALKWQTTNERDFDKFIVEYSSNGIDFVGIGIVAGTGTFSGISGYTFLHQNFSYTGSPLFYRLKLIDKDGSFMYSKVVKVHFTPIQTILVYPNPANHFIYLKPAQPIIKIEIINSKGQLCSVKTTGIADKINIAQLPKGAYTIKLFLNNYTETTQFTKF